MVIGALLVLVSPLLLHLCARVFRVHFRRPGYFLTLLGILVAALFHSLTFLPWPGLLAAAVVPPLCALILFTWVLELPPTKSLALWFTHGVSVLTVFFLALWGYESAIAGTPLNPIQEIPAIYRVALEAPGGPQDADPLEKDNQTEYMLIWPPSGSEWVDRRANLAQLTVQTLGDSWHVHVKDRFGKVQGDRRGNGGKAFSPVLNPDTDFAYFVQVSPNPRLDARASVESLVPLKE